MAVESLSHNQGRTQGSYTSKYLAAALAEDGLDPALWDGLIAMCTACPDNGVLRNAEGWVDLLADDPESFPPDGLFQLRKAGLLEIGVGGGPWIAIFRVVRGRLRGPASGGARTAIPVAVQRAVRERDGDVCAYCGSTTEPMELDHVHPLSRGGEHAASNIVVACRPCNRSKSAMTLSEWMGPK